MAYNEFDDASSRMPSVGGGSTAPRLQALPQSQPQGDKKNAPPPPNYTQLANQQAQRSREAIDRQTEQNRPNQVNAHGSTVTWEMGPDGRPVQRQSFGGQLGELAGGLTQQAVTGMGQSLTPFSFGGPMQGQLFGLDPSAARQQAIDAAYGQSTSRLDPMWNQREEQQRTQLLNQGLDPNSEAYKNAMGQLGMQRNDAYQGALNSAIGQGTQAGQALFSQGLGAFQANSDNAYRTGAYNDSQALQQRRQQLMERGLPLQELGQLSSFLGMPGFNAAGASTPAQLLQAGGMQDSSSFRNWDARRQAEADAWGAGLDLLTAPLPFIPKPK